VKRYSSKSIKGKLDKLVGNFFRSKPCDYYLTNPEHKCKGNLEWCHIKTRRYLSTRWLYINAFTLCSKAHRYFTDHPDEFIKWIEQNFPDRLETLQKEFNKMPKVDKMYLEELYEKLQKEYL